jgi:hypothetical protein
MNDDDALDFSQKDTDTRLSILARAWVTTATFLFCVAVES